MKNILLIGVGGTGSNAVDILYKKIKEFKSQTNNRISAIVFDTDVGCVAEIKDATPISMADTSSVGTICDRIGREYIRKWFPCDDKAVCAQEMIRGASQWRKKSYLAFLNLMNKAQARTAFNSALEKMTTDPSASCEVYVITSAAGGTGSGSFIPIALYTRRYLRKQLGKDPIVNAMIALPDIYADAQTPDNRIKIYANAYAILRELNAINLVARNYNDGGGRSKRKKSPINFKIGDINEPNVGLLFDSSDKQFWTPEAAPFTQIFVLDRIPGLRSIGAHDIVLANSLYSLICTEIGAAFDSEASNHEILRSQNNGSNAIFASISTSQMTFPLETILDYLAHKKALTSCDKEWLVLHREGEKELSIREREAKECGRRYIAKDGEYAQILLEKLQNNEDNDDGNITALVDRGTAKFDDDGKRLPESSAEIYFKKIRDAINERIPKIANEIELGIQDKKPSVEDVLDCASSVNSKLVEYYKICVEEIRRLRNSISEAIITFDRNKDVYAKNDLSLVNSILMNDNKFIHPVSAMIQLCRLKTLLVNETKVKFTEWEVARPGRREIEEVDPNLLDLKDVENNKYKDKYINLGTERFKSFINGEYEAAKKRDIEKDIVLIQEDIEAVVDNIYNEAKKQLRMIIFKRLSSEVDLLISKYKNFFNRFEKEKEDLEEETKMIEHRDCDLVDSIYNVYSSVDNKKYILKEVTMLSGPESEEDIVESDNIEGKGVFSCVYRAACAEKNDTEWNDKDSTAYRSLFNDMVEAYKESIRKSDAFSKLASYNIVQAMEASCGEDADMDKKTAVFRSLFSVVQDLAKPSLKIDTREDLGDLVSPSSIEVFMLSQETGKYIKKHAEELDIAIPSDQSNEKAVIKSCCEQFIRRFSGNDSARVTVVENMSNRVLYCSGEIMDITPLRIPKFNELSEGNDNIYYENYCKAIENYKHYNTDMWNPHIGNDLFKRGYLPFMNEAKEKIEDDRMIKALLYALYNGKIVYTNGLSQSRNIFSFRYVVNGIRTNIKGSDGNVVKMNNVAQLLSWLRNEDDLINEWSARFDDDMLAMKNALPNIASDNEISKLETQITKTNFMNMFHEKLFVDESRGKNVGPTVIEFAYLIKTSEETLRDCDDAERILDVIYDEFKKLCAFRANITTAPERFINIYKQQLEKIFESLAGSNIIQIAGGDCEAYFAQIVSWLESNETFFGIADEQAVNEKGEIEISAKFNIESFPKVKSALSEIVTKAKAKAKEVKE